MSSNFILPFDSPAASLACAGGKGANLAEMVRAGFGDRVPHGFIVAVEAYRTFVEANGIRARVLELARHVIPDVTQRRLGAKAVRVVSRPGGGVERLSRVEAGALEQALPDAQILELARLAHRVSAHFGSPQDIEWALSGGRLFLLQSRPITALYPLPEAPPDSDGTRVYVSLNAIQGVAEALTPLGIESLQVLFGGLLRVLGSPTPGREIFVPAGGRLFIDVTGPAHDPRLRHALLGGLSRAEPTARQVLLLLIEGGRIPERHLLTPRRALQLLRAVVPPVARGFRAMLVPERAVSDATDSVARRLARLRARAVGARDLRSRLDFIAESLSRGALEFAAPIFPLVIPAMAALTVVDEWLRDWLGLPPGTTLKLVRGLPGNVRVTILP